MRWIRLNIDFDDSPWLFDLSAEVQLAWIKLLCHVKRDGVKGRCRALSSVVAAKKWGVSRAVVERLIKAAEKACALDVEDEFWFVLNWDKYQTVDPTAAERMARYRERKDSSDDEFEPEAEVVTRNKTVTCHATETKTTTKTKKENQEKKDFLADTPTPCATPCGGSRRPAAEVVGGCTPTEAWGKNQYFGYFSDSEGDHRIASACLSVELPRFAALTGLSGLRQALNFPLLRASVGAVRSRILEGVRIQARTPVVRRVHAGGPDDASHPSLAKLAGYSKTPVVRRIADLRFFSFPSYPFAFAHGLPPRGREIWPSPPTPSPKQVGRGDFWFSPPGFCHEAKPTLPNLPLAKLERDFGFVIDFLCWRSGTRDHRRCLSPDDYAGGPDDASHPSLAKLAGSNETPALRQGSPFGVAFQKDSYSDVARAPRLRFTHCPWAGSSKMPMPPRFMQAGSLRSDMAPTYTGGPDDASHPSLAMLAGSIETPVVRRIHAGKMPLMKAHLWGGLSQGLLLRRLFTGETPVVRRGLLLRQGSDVLRRLSMGGRAWLKV